MWVDASKLGESLRPCYRNHFPHLLLKRLQGIDLSNNPEIYREEKHRYDQARLTCWLKVVDERRLLGIKSSKANSSDKKSGRGFMLKEIRLSSQLQMEEEHGIIRLTELIYMASSFRMHFILTILKNLSSDTGTKGCRLSFTFTSHHPIMMGPEKTRDIEFHLVQCSLGQKRYAHDSDKIEKEKQSRDGGHNEDLKNFVDKVDARWKSQRRSPYMFEELEEYEFYGVVSSKASAFALTLYNLIVLVEKPFVVVPLSEIEIFFLTVIFQDFKVDNVLEINSIPLKSLARIKHLKGIADFPKKFIDGLADCNTLVYYKEATDFPEKFIVNGGWDYVKFEDSDVSACHKEIALGPECVQMKYHWVERREQWVR
ncbi:hypothetical protein MKX01_011283 [Papaver californicum]|nr:hypothetical protein MKX01_011283 [Papaver californicum]